MIYTSFDRDSAIRWQVVRMTVVVLGSFIVGFWLVAYVSFSGPTVSATPQYTLDVPATPYVESEATVPALPARLAIPAIGVDAAVQSVGLDSNGSGDMAVPSNMTDVGWYSYGVRPGSPGTAVIAGHVSGIRTSEAVFYDLHTLAVGDEIIVQSVDEVEQIFRVTDIVTYAHDDATVDVFTNSDGQSHLNLITCGGTWIPTLDMFDERTVVFTTLVPASL